MKLKNNFIIHRSPEFYKYHVVNSDDVLKHGMEKACILGNLDKLFYEDRENFHEHFAYIEQKRFYKLLDKLIEDGYISYVEVSDE
jgi:DNA-binding PadR family transcriptional regulator